MADVVAVVLVEGASDQVALHALAERLGHNLEAAGVSIVSMGGASALGDFLDDLVGPEGPYIRVAGLCDEDQVGDFQRGLERAGFGSNLSRSDMESLGFYVCVADLEDELIRSLGADSVVDLLGAQGELGSFRTFQNQPAWRGRPLDQQLRRFMGVKSGRKERYGRLMVDAIDLDRAPAPLEGLLAHAVGG